MAKLHDGSDNLPTNVLALEDYLRFIKVTDNMNPEKSEWLDSYYKSVLQTMEFSFGKSFFVEKVNMDSLKLFVDEMHRSVIETVKDNVLEKRVLREVFLLCRFPLQLMENSGHKLEFNFITEVEKKTFLQCLFLVLLRPHIPLKYENMFSFLQIYPKFIERDDTEREKLKAFSNWVDLVFYTIPSKVRIFTASLFVSCSLQIDARRHLLTLISKIVDGSDFTNKTSEIAYSLDREDIYRMESELSSDENDGVRGR